MGKYTRYTLTFLAGLVLAFSISYVVREEEDVDGIKQELEDTKSQLIVLDGLYQEKRAEADKYKEHYKESLGVLKENSLMIDSLNRLQLEILYEEECDFEEDEMYYNLKMNRFE